MPIQHCTLPDGRPGFRWGDSGKCYTQRGAAEAQARAAYASGYREKADLGMLLTKNVDVDAHVASTSDLNLLRKPTEAQARAGNYPKGHTRVIGLNVTIENPAGSRRRPEWPAMTAHYGYVKRTEGADGDHVDVFIRPGTPDDWGGDVFVIDQLKADGSFDEHKCMIGWDSERDARRAYSANYDTGWYGLGAVSRLSQDAFRRWLRVGDTTKPLRKGEWNEDDHPREENGQFGAGGTGASRGEDGVWRGSDGNALSDADQARITMLGVYPGWTDVRLNSDPTAARQAVGRDTKGRTVSVYSSEHSATAAAEKFARLREFTQLAPKIAAQASKDMLNKELSPAARDAAAVVHLIAQTGFRIGSTKDTGAAKQAYGASTLRGGHVQAVGDKLRFSFTGKSGVEITKELSDKKLAAYIREKGVSGTQRLFNVTDKAVRDYFRSISGGDFKVKDLRTWNGTAAALREIAKVTPPRTKTELVKARAAVGKVVAAHLGNTPSVALKSYIAPEVFTGWSSSVHLGKRESSNEELLAEFFETRCYDNDGDWRNVPATEDDPDDEERVDLSKMWVASNVATSGITAYGTTGRKKRAERERRVKLLPQGAEAITEEKQA